MNHLDYLEEMGMNASEWEKTTNAVAQELVSVLREKGCTYVGKGYAEGQDLSYSNVLRSMSSFSLGIWISAK